MWVPFEPHKAFVFSFESEFIKSKIGATAQPGKYFSRKKNL